MSKTGDICSVTNSGFKTWHMTAMEEQGAIDYLTRKLEAEHHKAISVTTVHLAKHVVAVIITSESVWKGYH